MGTPAALMGALGTELVELRVDGDTASALGLLRSRGVAGDDAFSVGTTIIIPLRQGSATAVIAEVAALGLPTAGISARPPTLDDVFLRLTGDRLAA
jgi:ABC-2 type transport system ATP-binding protein